MLQYNHETSDIARPSEVLHSIRAFMSALRSIELHGTFCVYLFTYIYTYVLDEVECLICTYDQIKVRDSILGS